MFVFFHTSLTLRIYFLLLGLVLLMFCGLTVPEAFGADMRVVQMQVKKAEEALQQKAAAELREAELSSAKNRARIREDKAALQKAISDLKAEIQNLRQTVDTLTIENERLEAEDAQLVRQVSNSDSMIRELVGVIRVNAKDVEGFVRDNLQSALFHPKVDFIDALAGQARFPGMADIEKLVDTLFEQISQSGTVFVQKADMVDRSGREITADILVLGTFCAAYHTDQETGFLTYAPPGQKLYALSRLPAGRIQNQIERYLQGRDQAVPMDISRGAALRQMTHELRLWEQIPKGGPIVWPILAILLIGVVIVGERTFFLLRKRFDAGSLVNQIEQGAAARDWDICQATCRPHGGKPVVRVLQAGLNACELPREDMENALQEAILKEIPPMERFLSTLGMLATIAPLLGLLGTVNGMINTFHVITHYGTGDPRMMSGGISEALVTTMLGLAVAIPIMLSHTLLSRSVENTIGQMEEKAVALVHLVQKFRNA